jgi:adenylate kinase family enzyme
MKRAESSGRVDDNIDSFKKRLVTYQTETKPVLERFKTLGKLQQVNAERAIDVIFADIKTLLAK